MTTNSITLAGISSGGQYGLGASSNTAVIGPKFLRTTDIVSGEIDWSRVPYCKADQKTIDKYRLSDGDIVISRTGANAGLTAFVTSPPENSIFAGYLVRFKIDRDRAVPKFVSYILVSDTWKHYVATTRTGSAQPQFNAKIMGDFPMLLPSIQVQKASSEILGALDEKIQINKELSKTLEDIAQTIFKSWFIDFDPVKAKMAGEKPVGMDDATAALFPDSMEDSELGLIPVGWAWKTVGDIADVIDCLHSKKPELLEAGLPYLQLDAISNDGVLRFDKAGKISEEDYKKWTARIEVAGGDCLITNVGRVGAVSQVPNHFKGAIGRNLTAMRPISMEKHRTLLVSALTSDFMAGEITKNTDAGTILEALNVRSIPRLRVPVPNDETLHVFELTCGPMWLQAHELHRQNVQLAALRDSLLPRLISGELQIPEEMLVT